MRRDYMVVQRFLFGVRLVARVSRKHNYKTEPSKKVGSSIKNMLSHAKVDVDYGA